MNWKKLLSIALSTVLSLALAAPAFASGQPEGWTPADGARQAAPWYAEAVDYVTEKGYMVGTGNGFEPEALVTFYSVLQTLYNREGSPNASENSQPWYADAAAWWQDLSGETITGKKDFNPVRSEIRSLLHVYAGKKGFSDEGLMVGDKNGDMMDSKTLTRAEFAQILMRLDKLAPTTEAKYHVAVLVPNPTDGSYYEAGVNGAKALADTQVDVVAMGSIAAGAAMPTQEEELAQYKPFFTEACESGKYDLIITAGAECNPALLDAAKAYPEQKFLSYDLQSVPSELATTPLSNVYGVTYKNQDLGYLAGFIASKITVSDMTNANADKKIGIILGMDVPGINDYAGSFCQAAKEQGVTVYVDYVGDFLSDLAPVAAGKAKAMYDDGVDVIWQVAGGAGKGVFTAAKECGRYALGVDCDQVLTTADADEAATIVTSFYANSPAVIADAWAALLKGEFPGGTYPTVGLAEGYVGFADNAQFEAMTSQALRDAAADLFKTMAEGKTEVFQASADLDAWTALKASVAP